MAKAIFFIIYIYIHTHTKLSHVNMIMTHTSGGERLNRLVAASFGPKISVVGTLSSYKIVESESDCGGFVVKAWSREK